MSNKTLPIHLANPNISLYGGLGERVAAAFLDGLILTPVTLGLMYFNAQHLYYYYYTFVVSLVVIAAYCIYLPVRYGATPGKRIMGLTILKTDGAAISYRESFLKYLPMLAIGLFAAAGQCLSIAAADPTTYDSLNWIKQMYYLRGLSPIPLSLQILVINGYYIGTLIMVAAEQRNRSLSDVLAGTVVVNSRHLDKIAALTETEVS